jgi:hypothetical protein
MPRPHLAFLTRSASNIGITVGMVYYLGIRVRGASSSSRLLVDHSLWMYTPLTPYHQFPPANHLSYSPGKCSFLDLSTRDSNSVETRGRILLQ